MVEKLEALWLLLEEYEEGYDKGYETSINVYYNVLFFYFPHPPHPGFALKMRSTIGVFKLIGIFVFNAATFTARVLGATGAVSRMIWLFGF
jgi:hypothetical protein